MLLRFKHFAALVVAVSLAAVSGPARAQTTQTHFTAQRTIHFSASTDQDRKMLSGIPSARDMVAWGALIAREDLNDDGSKEVILVANGSDMCGTHGCEVEVLESRNGKAVRILDRILQVPLAVTNEKIGQYRALASVDDTGAILEDDQPATANSSKQHVYAMNAPYTLDQKEVDEAIKSFLSSQGSEIAFERESAASQGSTVADLSGDGKSEIILVWTLFGPTYWRNTLTVFTKTAAGYTPDASLPLNGEAKLSSAKAGIIVVDQVEYAKNDALCCPSIKGLVKYRWLGKQIVELTGAPAERPTTAAAAQPAVSGEAPVSPAAASSQVDACGGKPRCYSAGPFTAEVISMTPSQTPPGSAFPSHVLQVNVRFRNLTNLPLILAYVSGSGVITDNNGNRYDDQRYGFTSAAKGIGTVDRTKADPQFVLGSGASSNASFVLARGHVVNDPRDPIGTTFNFDLSIAQLEVPASGQVSSLRNYSVGFTDLGNSAALTGSSPRTPAAAQPSVSGEAPVSPAAGSSQVDACGGKLRCYSAGLFTAEVIGMTPSQTPPGSVFPCHVLQVNVRFRNLTNQPLILAYVSGSGVITDNNGSRYDDQRYGFTSAAKGIGTVDRTKADPQFVLGAGASSNASFVLARGHVVNDPRDPIGTTFNFDLSIARLEALASQQIQTVREYAVNFQNLTDTRSWAGKALSHILPKKQ